jgi:hypothetical protein
MVRTQFWLREFSTLVFQYLGVVFASIPAGMLYLITLKVTQAHYVALVSSVIVGILIAHLVWQSIYFRMASTEVPILAIRPSDRGFQGVLSMTSAGLTISVNLRTHRRNAIRPLSDDPRDTGLYVVPSYDKFVEPLFQ